jgi:AraC-like DNA-binding protein
VPPAQPAAGAAGAAAREDGEARALALQGTLQLLAMETGQPGLGSSLLVSRLADIVFVQAVRAHVAAHGESQAGWLAALGDARIGPALRAMRKDMARDWTMASLATAASLSRSAFAQRFRERVGQAPLEYLTQWRMFKAGNMLGQGNAAVGHDCRGGRLRLGGGVQQGFQAREGHGAGRVAGRGARRGRGMTARRC